MMRLADLGVNVNRTLSLASPCKVANSALDVAYPVPQPPLSFPFAFTSMRGDKIITVTPNIASVFELFQVDRLRYRVIDVAPCLPFTPPNASALSQDPIIERVERPPQNAPQTGAEQLLLRRQADRGMRRFRTMSVFSGAGGIDIGMADTGAFRTECAIDACANSAATFATHHPNTHFLCMDAGAALQQRVALGMPRAGEVDVMLLGPPCQSFSTLNRQYDDDRFDSRSLLVATGLSYVDVYRPAYGCIENVCGMLSRGLCGSVKRKGTIRFIRACLTAMGYNVRFCKVQSGYYGVPQSRERVKFIFAPKTVTLPAAPVPTHKLAGDPYRNKGGPLPAVTIADATSDLPRWEYRNPHLLRTPEQTLRDDRATHRRPRQFDSTDPSGSVGLRDSTYLAPPTNSYQHMMRPGRHADPRAIVQQHVAKHLSAIHVERICNIPFRAGANHLELYRDGRGKLGVAMTEEMKADGAFKHAYQRLDANGSFQIVTTEVTLQNGQGRLLMPDQQRIPTIREMARAQGFPDAAVFSGSVASQQEQIGNAVPIPLARAIGFSIREAAIDDYLRGDHRFRRV